MKYRMLKQALCLATLQISMAGAYAADLRLHKPEQEITRMAAQSSVACSEQFFTGQTQIHPVWAADEYINTSGAYVTFDPGARSA